MKYTNANLPPGCQDNGIWRRIFIPTYLQYLACQDSNTDAWAVNNDEGVSIQQKIWDFVYGGKVPHIITVHGPIFALVGVHFFLPSTNILITHLSTGRLINVSANGAVDLLPLPCPSSMPFSTTTTTNLTTTVKVLQILVWNPMRFFTVKSLPRMVR